MQFMNLPRECWVKLEDTWRKCLGVSMEGMVLVELDNSEQKILHHKLILREDMLWPTKA